MTISSLNMRRRFFYASIATLAGLIFYLILAFSVHAQFYGNPYQQNPQGGYPAAYPPVSIPPQQSFGYPSQPMMGGYGQPSYVVGPQGMTPQPGGAQPPQAEQAFKPILETFPAGTQGWSDSKTTVLDVNGNKATVLGVFAGSKGSQALFKTFSLQGARKFKVDIDFYFYKSWDSEILSVFFNDKAIAQYTYNFQQPFTANKCKILIDKIPFDTAYWPSRKVQCSYDGVLDNGKMTIEGQDVTNPSAPTSLKIGFGNNLDQDINDEGFALEQIAITPVAEAGTGTAATGTTDSTSQIPRRINITVLSPYPVPMSSGSGGTPTGSPYPLAPNYFQQQNQPAPNPAPVQQPVSQKFEPQYYSPLGQSPVEDHTTGFATDEMTREGASKCAVCQSPSQDARDTKFCLENCVTLPRQTVMNMDQVNNEIQQENDRLKKELEKFRTPTPEKKPTSPQKRRR